MQTSRILKVATVPTILDCFPERLQSTSSKRKAPATREALKHMQKRESGADVADGREDTSTLSQDVDGEIEGDDDTCAGGQHDHCECVLSA